MGFLTREPNSFECRDRQDQWKPCTKEEICSQNLSHEDYRPVKDDEYIDNWEEPDKFDTLCTPQWKVGLLGSMFFAGAVSTLLFIPWLSDKKFGRKAVVRVTLVISIVSQLGLILITDINWAYVFIFIGGACFAGKIFIALTYTIEFAPNAYHYMIPFVYLLTEPFFVILLTFWY